MPKKVKRRVGDIFKISLSGGRLALGIVLKEPLMAFFDCVFEEEPDEFSGLIGSQIVFKVWVMNRAITRGLWPVLGNVDPTVVSVEEPWFFRQDPISKKLTQTRDGADSIPATLEECRNLERAAVWDPEHAIDRLEDHFAGRANKWVDLMRVKV